MIETSETGKVPGFAVQLDNFEGPFDLLLQLIAKHRLDVTEVALSQVTDEFISHIRAMGDGWDLGHATEFLVVAATLLDLKAARLLPSGEVEDEGDLALLEARDILFARLLQYRAYKEVAAIFSQRYADEAHRFPRMVSLEPAYASLLPEVLIGIGPDRFASLAHRILSPKIEQFVPTSHLHDPAVNVREQATIILEKIRSLRSASFRSLISDAPNMNTIVARFLALLELYREGVLHFDQVTPLGELHIKWVGAEDAEINLTDEFDIEVEEDNDE